MTLEQKCFSSCKESVLLSYLKGKDSGSPREGACTAAPWFFLYCNFSEEQRYYQACFEQQSSVIWGGPSGTWIWFKVAFWSYTPGLLSFWSSCAGQIMFCGIRKSERTEERAFCCLQRVFHHLQSKCMSYDDVSQRFQQLKNWRWQGIFYLTGSLRVIENRLGKHP